MHVQGWYADVIYGRHNRVPLELGRHNRVRLENRLCIKCNCQAVEDELHAFISCTAHEVQRHILFQYITHQYPNFNNLNAEERFIWLLSNEDKAVVNMVSKFVTCILKRGR